MTTLNQEIAKHVEYLKGITEWHTGDTLQCSANLAAVQTITDNALAEFAKGGATPMEKAGLCLWVMMYQEMQEHVEAYMLRVLRGNDPDKDAAADVLGVMYANALKAGDHVALEFLRRQTDCIANDVTRSRTNASFLIVVRVWLAIIQCTGRNPMSQKEITEIAVMAGDKVSKTRVSEACMAINTRLAWLSADVMLDCRVKGKWG